MKIFCPGIERNDVGGGGTFLQNLTKGLNRIKSDIAFVDNPRDCDIFFIAGASLVDRVIVEEAKKAGKKIVLRIDNILEDRANRNSGMPRIRDFAKLADIVVYQSKWAYRLMKPYCESSRDKIIYNGVDTDLFKPGNERKIDIATLKGVRILYSKHSRNEVKRFHEVQYFMRELAIDKIESTLVLIGRFANDYTEVNNPFEMHNGEKVEYYGLQTGRQLVAFMQSCDVALLPYFADACSNTILECQACGIPVLYHAYGGSKELIEFGHHINWDNAKPSDMVRYALGEKTRWHPTEYENKWGLKRMAEDYLNVFNSL